MEDEYVKIIKGDKPIKMTCPFCAKECNVLILKYVDEFYCLDCGNTFTETEKFEAVDKIIKKLTGETNDENHKLHGKTVLEEFTT